jgi:NAD(P)-dependent dehydrogenase (short-subunit alcohol dehydrogenase family)
MNEIFSPTVLRDKVSIVTGAGRGLGKVMALALAGAGSDIILTARTVDEIERTSKEITDIGRKALAIKMDITRSADISKMVEKAVSEFGKIDILVNNAGQNASYANHSFEDIPEDEWIEMIQTNVNGTFLVTRIVGRSMLEKGEGKIINISSSFGVKAIPTRICYSVSKAAVIQMTRSVAVEWGNRGVTVNCIAPGSINMFPDSTNEEYLAMNRERVKIVPQGRLGSPEELGPLLIYLASEASDYINGETIFMDGGLAAR